MGEHDLDCDRGEGGMKGGRSRGKSVNQLSKMTRICV